ncbi:MAG: hypothetical protein K2X00_20685 [Nitrospiraceae bacterium]|nr:hypothetical protein [Nitrospiraceae bacterium]
MMQRHEAWRLAYRMDRYLRSAANSDIEQRSRDITLNMMNVNDTGQLSAEVPSEEAMVWWELWTHILEELSLRSVDYRTLDLMPPFPWISHPDAPRGLKILGKRQLPNKDFISRVGQREHMKAAYEHGRFRIAPATTYSDPSLNPAIRDEELSVTAVRSGDTAKIHRYDPKTGKTGDPIHAIGNVTFSTTWQENFFVLCLTSGYRPRILDDFEANSLLVIHNVNRFLIRLKKAVKRARPDLAHFARPITYYDPYRVDPKSLEAPFAKNFRYAYQREFRAVWHKPGLGFDERPFFIEMGTLRDIATLLNLPG